MLVASGSDPTSFALVETDGVGRYVATDIVVGPVTVKAVFDTSSGVAAGNLQRAGTFASVDVTINLTAGRVSGGVFELDGGDVSTPVAAIEVFYLILGPQSNELIAAQTKTDGNGRFTFQEVPAGPFRVLALDRVRSRQASASDELVVVNGVAVIEELDVIFFTEDVGTIEGRVSNADGVPAEAVIVSAAGRQILTASSGDSSGLAPGAFRFTDISFGTYTVTARKPGSSGSTSAQAIVADASTPVNVSLVLPGSGRIVVTVLDVDGTPIPNQQVLRASECSGVPATTGSDPSNPATFGVAFFEDVPIGNVSVKAIRGADLAAASAFIRRDGDEATLILRFAGFGTATGTVIDPAGDPVLGASVVLGSRRLVSASCSFVQDGAAQQVRTGVDGTFRFNNVPVGAITVSASSVFFPVSTTMRDALLVDGDIKDFELALVSKIAGELNGTIFLPDGVTPAGIGVDVAVSGGSLPDVTVRTDVDGRYSFAKIFSASRYTLTASDSVTGKLTRETIFLQEDQDLTVDMRLLGRSSVEVTVVDGAGELIEEAFVQLASASFPFDKAAGAITASDAGKILFDRISEGSFSVTAADSLGRGGRGSGTVTEDGADVQVTISLSVTGTLRGSYVNADGTEPIPNAEVILRQGTTGRLLGATTTSNLAGELGTFEFLFAPAGTLLATATDPITGRIGEASATIETEGEIVDVEIRQLGLGKIAGTVTSGGAPVASAEVALTSSTGLSGLARSVANLRASATTDASGGFMFDGVPVGIFTLQARVPGLLLAGTATGAIDRDAQEITDIELALEPSGTVSGDVFRPDGATTVPAAALTLRLSKGVLRTDANASGRYLLDFVPSGELSLT